MNAMRKSPPSEKKPPHTNRTKLTVPISDIFANLNSSLLCSTKPNPNPNSNGKILDTDYSDAETSIGSSNVQSTPPRLPLIGFGNKSHGVSEPVYHRKEDPEKTKDEGEKIFLPLTIYSSAQKAKIKRKSSAQPSGKTKDTKKLMLMPLNCTPMVNERKRNKENIEPLSCPPLTKTRKKRTVSGEAGNTVSRSFTAPPGKHNKKTRQFLVDDDSVHALPLEYIEQQRAYFKEVDDFELVEEDASENESDNEEQVVKYLTQ